MSEPRVGVHLSLGRNPRLSLQDAAAHGVQCMQMFASSPGAWKSPVLLDLRTTELLDARREFDLDPLFIHAIYLINLASDNPILVDRSKASLIATLRAGSALHASGVITHIGSHLGRGFDQVADQIAKVLLDILDVSPTDIDLILENSAGAGGIIGSAMSELAVLLERASYHPRLKIALDTAHLCGAGWDFSDPRTAGSLVQTVDQTVGPDRLSVLHANDSRVPPGSRKDRHANVGKGFVGEAGFRSLLAQPALAAIPWILETPDLDTQLPVDERFGSIATLKALIDSGHAERVAGEGFVNCCFDAVSVGAEKSLNRGPRGRAGA